MSKTKGATTLKHNKQICLEIYLDNAPMYHAAWTSAWVNHVGIFYVLNVNASHPLCSHTCTSVPHTMPVNNVHRHYLYHINDFGPVPKKLRRWDYLRGLRLLSPRELWFDSLVNLYSRNQLRKSVAPAPPLGKQQQQQHRWNNSIKNSNNTNSKALRTICNKKKNRTKQQ